MENDIKSAVKMYILDEFLPGEDPNELADTTPLITGRILDSLSTLKLVTFLEENYRIEFHAYEVKVDNLNTLNDIAHIVQSKL
jgi:acyl carrier protein